MIDKIKEVLRYDPETGIFRWKKPTSNRVREGEEAGTPHPAGYIKIMVFGKRFYAHRLAWMFVYGVEPENEIDHIDGIKTNNRIANLRDVPMSINRQNVRKPRRDNLLTGLLGVSQNKRTGKFTARIQTGGEYIHLGTFSTPEEAHSAYLDAKRTLHAGCTI